MRLLCLWISCCCLLAASSGCGQPTRHTPPKKTGLPDFLQQQVKNLEERNQRRIEELQKLTQQLRNTPNRASAALAILAYQGREKAEKQIGMAGAVEPPETRGRVKNAQEVRQAESELAAAYRQVLKTYPGLAKNPMQGLAPADDHLSATEARALDALGETVRKNDKVPGTEARGFVSNGRSMPTPLPDGSGA